MLTSIVLEIRGPHSRAHARRRKSATADSDITHALGFTNWKPAAWRKDDGCAAVPSPISPLPTSFQPSHRRYAAPAQLKDGLQHRPLAEEGAETCAYRDDLHCAAGGNAEGAAACAGIRRWRRMPSASRYSVQA